jgi:hypothetical protein
VFSVSRVALWGKEKRASYASATGRFVRKPNMKDARPEIAAVVVIKSL